MKLGDVIAYAGRRYIVVGFDPIGVRPKRIYLRDPKTGATITPPLAEAIKAAKDPAMPRPS